jgi:hypothetical protein
MCEARVRLVVRKDLEGERSPGRRGRLPVGNDRADATDSMTEQGLEADVPALWSIEGRLWQRRRSEVPSGIGGNGKGATATVTWCGCRRGESFEGCENRRGESVGTPDGTWIRPGVGREPGSVKRDEPQDWQRDATSPRPPSGGNRRGGAKPRGRNGISRVGSLGTEARAERRVWEWMLGGMSVEGWERYPEQSGPTARESQERRSVIRPGRRVSTLKGSQGPRVRSIPRSFGSAAIGGTRRKTSKTRRATGKVREGAEKPTIRYGWVPGEGACIG